MPTSANPKTYRVKSFGCQMNVYDGERMAELLAEEGITPAPEGEGGTPASVDSAAPVRSETSEKR